MTNLPTLRAWLDTLHSAQVQTVLAHVPTAHAGARLRDLDELAMRLEHPYTVSQTMRSAPAPVVQLVEAVAALGAAPPAAGVHHLLARSAPADQHTGKDQRTGQNPHAGQVDHWVEQASTRALLWRDGERIRLNPGIDQVLPMPLALARPARVLLTNQTADDLRRMLRNWGMKAPARKAELLAAVAAVFDDPQALRRIAGSAPAEILTALTRHVNRGLTKATGLAAGGQARPEEDAPDAGNPAEGGPDEDDEDEQPYRFDPAAQEMRRWAIQHGLAFGYGGWAWASEFPSEVYLALAGPAFRARFEPEPPALVTVPAPPEQVGRSSAAAASQFLGTAMAILEALARGGMKPLKNGGVGARELTRLAKQVGSDVATVRLVLYLGAPLGIIDYTGDGLIGAGGKFETWRRAPAAERAADLVGAWLPLYVTPTLERDVEGTYLPALGNRSAASEMPIALVMGELLAQHPGRAVSLADLLALIDWRHPLTDTVPGAAMCTWEEGHQLGALADGALTPFTEALMSDDHRRAVALLTGMLPEASSQVIFGSDLTIVIPGSPDPEAVDVLDVLATREGHGVANTWRVSPESVRAALDAGHVVEDLIEALRALAGEQLPQALEYLLSDVARRHGHLAVRPAAAVITSEDEALLAEVVATRSLRALRLTLAAPTVAVAATPPAETLKVLRSAGYLPVEADDGGAPVVQIRRLAIPAPPGGDGGPGSEGGPGSKGGPGTGDQAGSHDQSSAGDQSGATAANGPGPDSGMSISPEEAMAGLDEANLRAFLADAGARLPEALGSYRPVSRAGRRGTHPETPAETAARLLSGASAQQADRSEMEELITAQAKRLSPAEVHELADAVEHSRPVHIRYRSNTGGISMRMVSELQILGWHLYAYCHDKQDARTFRLDQILAVMPV